MGDPSNSQKSIGNSEDEKRRTDDEEEQQQKEQEQEDEIVMEVDSENGSNPKTPENPTTGNSSPHVGNEERENVSEGKNR